jgi:hypothetical protein
MPASQTTTPQELTQGSRQSPAILQHLLLTICVLPRQRHNIEQTLACYVDDTQILLETHRREQTVDETPTPPQ